MRSGDWLCGGCNTSNFASKSKCRNCNVPRVVKNAGDWLCSCSEFNFASRDKCRKCGINKSRPDTKRKPGDWDCSCGEVNFGSRTQCRKCSRDKQGECAICFEITDRVCLKSCGHVAMCPTCALSLTTCPICRKAYIKEDIIKIYLA